MQVEMGKSINTPIAQSIAVNALSQTKLTTTELKAWLEKETGSVLAPVQAKAQEQRNQTQAAIQNLVEASKQLLDASQKEIDKRNMKVFNRARALNKLAGMFIERLKKVKAPDHVAFDTLAIYSNEAQRTLAVVEVDIRNWFPRISPFFIMDRRKFMAVYEKSRLTSNALSDFLNKDYVKSKTLEKTFQLIEEVQAVERQLAELEAAKASLHTERQQLGGEVAQLEQQATQIRATSTIEQIGQLDCEAEALNNELKQVLNHLQKPFLKMQALATYGGGGGITPDELRMIGLYMENPFLAVTEEQQGYPTLKSILEKLTVMLAEDKLKLKSDKQRKAEQAIIDIEKTETLSSLQSRSIAVAVRRKQLLKSEETEAAKQALNSIQRRIENLKTREGNLETDEILKEQQRRELAERIHGYKRNIEANAQTFMGKQVQVA